MKNKTLNKSIKNSLTHESTKHKILEIKSIKKSNQKLYYAGFMSLKGISSEVPNI